MIVGNGAWSLIELFLDYHQKPSVLHWIAEVLLFIDFSLFENTCYLPTFKKKYTLLRGLHLDKRLSNFQVLSFLGTNENYHSSLPVTVKDESFSSILYV